MKNYIKRYIKYVDQRILELNQDILTINKDIISKKLLIKKAENEIKACKKLEEKYPDLESDRYGNVYSSLVNKNYSNIDIFDDGKCWKTKFSILEEIDGVKFLINASAVVKIAEKKFLKRCTQISFCDFRNLDEVFNPGAYKEIKIRLIDMVKNEESIYNIDAGAPLKFIFNDNDPSIKTILNFM